MMTSSLLELCDKDIGNAEVLSMTKDANKLLRLCPSQLVLPLQDSMTVLLPATATLKDVHKPFRTRSPTFARKNIMLPGRYMTLTWSF